MTRRLVAAVAVLALLLTGACGLPEDDGPQALAREDLPPDLLDPDPSSSTTLPGSGPTVTVYFLQRTPNGGVRLAQVERRVRDARTPKDRLAALFAGLDTDEASTGLSTQIPTDTVLRNVETNPESDEVIIDVSGDLLTSIQGEFLSQAFAQIVWTATEPSAGGYTNVRFLVDGVPQSVINGEGVEQDGAVDRADYSSLSPPR